MTFDEWHQKQLNGDADNCPHEAWERKAWDAAILAEREACAKVVEANYRGVYDSHTCAAAIRGRSNA